MPKISVLIVLLLLLAGCSNSSKNVEKETKEVDCNLVINQAFNELPDTYVGDRILKELLPILTPSNTKKISDENITKLMICGIYIQFKKISRNLGSYNETEAEFNNKFNNFNKVLQAEGKMIPSKLNEYITKLTPKDQRIAYQIISQYKNAQEEQKEKEKEKAEKEELEKLMKESIDIETICNAYRNNEFQAKKRYPRNTYFYLKANLYSIRSYNNEFDGDGGWKYVIDGKGFIKIYSNDFNFTEVDYPREAIIKAKLGDYNISEFYNAQLIWVGKLIK